MFNFFKKKNRPTTNFSRLKTDFHSHLIPGIDDGADTMEAALELIKGMKGLGFQKLITTPHIMADMYPNTSEAIRNGLDALREAVAQEGIEIEIEAAAEYMMDELFHERLENKDLLTFGENYVLVEMGFISEPPGIDRALFKLQTKGYTPILAHPERYLFLQRDLSRYERLKEQGCLFQLNTLSYIGYYGKPTRELAAKLLKKGWIDFVGTDLHHERHLARLEEGIADRKVANLLEEYTFQNINL